MSTKVNWVNGLSFLGEDDAGHQVLMDAAPEAGGADAGFRPADLLLHSLAGCSAIDSLLFMQKLNQVIRSFQIVVNGERSESSPKYFKHIEIVYRVGGESLSEDKVKTAIMFGLEKYCAVAASLKSKISWKLEIVP